MKIKKILILLFAIIFINLDIIKAYEKYNIGDIINYKGIDYYVISNSNEKKSYVTLIKATPLNGTEISNYANGSINKEIIGEIPFASNPQTCQNVDNNGGCTSIYNDTVIKQIVDVWASDNIGQNNYQEARLINNDDLNNLDFGMVKECAQTTFEHSCYYGSINNSNLRRVTFDGVEYWQIENDSFTAFSCSPIGGITNCDFKLCYGGQDKGNISDYIPIIEDNSSGCAQYSTSQAELITSKDYNWLNYNNIPYWTMAIDYSYSNTDPNSKTNYIYYYNPEIKMMKSSKSNDSGLHRLNAIRPVIELKKANIDNHKDTYQIGEEIIINKEKYNVIKNSDSNDEYVTVLKYKPLTQFQIDSYLSNDKEGLTNYYISDTCNSKNNSDGCEYDYSKSNVKTIVDNWTQNNTNEFDLYEKGNYKSRLITLDELINNLGYEKKIASFVNISASEDTPKWIYENIDNYWMMPVNINSSETITELKNALKVSMYVVPTETFNSGTVRPVINLRKCAIGDSTCNSCVSGTPVYKKVSKYNEYEIGEKITYKDEEYYVIGGLSSDDNYVTAIKAKKLSTNELSKYGKDDNNEFFVNKYNHKGQEFVSSDSMISFITNENCSVEYSNIGTIIVTKDSECNNNYETSDVKRVIDAWAKDKLDLNELINIDGYKYRLINEDDLLNLSFEKNVTPNTVDSVHYNTENVKYEFLTNINTWTMIPGNRDNKVFRYNNFGTKKQVEEQESYMQNYIHPVININKCALDGGCYEEDVLIGCDETENNTDVKVENTLNSVSKIVLITSLLLIISGVSIIIIYYKKAKKEKQ